MPQPASGPTGNQSEICSSSSSSSDLTLVVGPERRHFTCSKQVLEQHSAFVRQYLEDVESLDTGDSSVLPLPDLDPAAVGAVLEALGAQSGAGPVAELEDLCRAVSFLQLEKSAAGDALKDCAEQMVEGLPKDDHAARKSLLAQTAQLGVQYDLWGLEWAAACQAFNSYGLDLDRAQWPDSTWGILDAKYEKVLDLQRDDLGYSPSPDRSDDDWMLDDGIW